MAGGSIYHDEDSAPITDINVTPFVDILLVLVVVFMVTAKLIVNRGIEIKPPEATTGGEVQSTLRISVTDRGELYIKDAMFADDAAAVAHIKELISGVIKPAAIIAGDRRSAYAGVMRAIDIVHQAGIKAISLENIPR